MDKNSFTYFFIKQFLRECAKPLDADQTKALFRAYKVDKDMDAYNQLLLGYAYFAAIIVLKRYGYTLLTQDLIQHAAWESVPKAIVGYAPDNPYGASFSTYARTIIVRDAAEYYFKHNALVSGISDADRRHAMWLNTRFLALVQEGCGYNEAMVEVTRRYVDHHRTKSYDQLTEPQKREVEQKVCMLLNLTTHPLSMDYSAAKDSNEDYNMFDNIAADACYNPEDVALELAEPEHVALAEALAKLPERTRNMVLMHAGIGQKDERPRTLQEIADYYHVSRQYVGKVIDNALAFLRTEMMARM